MRVLLRSLTSPGRMISAPIHRRTVLHLQCAQCPAAPDQTPKINAGFLREWKGGFQSTFGTFRTTAIISWPQKDPLRRPRDSKNDRVRSPIKVCTGGNSQNQSADCDVMATCRPKRNCSFECSQTTARLVEDRPLSFKRSEVMYFGPPLL